MMINAHLLTLALLLLHGDCSLALPQKKKKDCSLALICSEIKQESTFMAGNTCGSSEFTVTRRIHTAAATRPIQLLCACDSCLLLLLHKRNCHLWQPCHSWLVRSLTETGPRSLNHAEKRLHLVIVFTYQSPRPCPELAGCPPATAFGFSTLRDRLTVSVRQSCESV